MPCMVWIQDVARQVPQHVTALFNGQLLFDSFMAGIGEPDTTQYLMIFFTVTIETMIQYFLECIEFLCGQFQNLCGHEIV